MLKPKPKVVNYESSEIYRLSLSPVKFNVKFTFFYVSRISTITTCPRVAKLISAGHVYIIGNKYN